jgi:hypothetical protein
LITVSNEIRYGLALSTIAIDNHEQREGPSMNIELRGLLRAWNSHWANYEYMGASSHVRAGWMYHDESDLQGGRESRVARLSRNGVDDVLQEFSWLDNEVPTFLNNSRFPRQVTHPTIHAATHVTTTPHDPIAAQPLSSVSNGVHVPANATMETDDNEAARSTPVAALISQVQQLHTN